jgi:cation:H+ antiporter
MSLFVFHLTVYAISFIAMWFGSGLVLSSVVRLATSLRLPRFIVSFFVLGLMTSLSETMIGSLSVIEGKPEIFVGNLIGGVVVLFFLLIPLLAMIGNGVRVPKNFSTPELLLTFTVIISPSFFTLQQKIFPVQGIFLIALYCLLFIFLSSKSSLLEKVTQSFKRKPLKEGPLFLKLGIGFILLLAASHQIINSTVFFSDYFNLSQFFISLIIIAIGSNIPELSLILRSVFEKKQDVALADYFGSASANTLLFGIFSLVYAKPIALPDHVMQRFLFILTGLVLFFFFSRSKSIFSRKEASILIGLYFLFLALEFFYIQ